MIIHTAQRGEDLISVAGKYGVSPLKLAAMNDIRTRGLIEGEELLVLIPTRTASARRNERLSELARRYGVREGALFLMNPELCSGGDLYAGQPITVRAEPPLFGLGIGNGYFYRGTPRDRLMRALPFMSYLTVASPVVRRGGISSMFDAAWVLELARAHGILTLLRLYICEGEELTEELVRSAALMAKGGGYFGLTLAGISPSSPMLKTARELTEELGLKLVVERDAEGEVPECDAADLTVLIYDKIEKPKVPDPAEGEERILRSYAERHNAVRAFLDLSPFAASEGKYMTKGELRESLYRRGGSISELCRGTKLAALGRGSRKSEWIFESLSGVEGRLKLLSELGYYGVSFDIARTPTSELMMFGTMFSHGIRLH